MLYRLLGRYQHFRETLSQSSGLKMNEVRKGNFNGYNSFFAFLSIVAAREHIYCMLNCD